MNKIIAWAILQVFMCITQITAQPYSAFLNVRNEFNIFDNGIISRAEALRPMSYKIGKTGITYLSNMGVLKIYKDGDIQVLNDLTTTDYDVSDNLILFRAANKISVIENGELTTLSKLCDRYKMGDSVVLFYDAVTRSLNGYYQGKITELEGFLNLDDNDFKIDSSLKVSDNIGAYINYNEQFKVFYQHNSEVLENQAVKQFQVGRNIVGYIDINNIFKIYYKGQTYVIDPFAPKKFLVGDDVVAYYSSDGYFKIFHRGNLYTIGYYEPEFEVVDRIVAFKDINGYFKVFHEGVQENIDIYYPDKFILGYNSLAYVNKANMLRLFSKGKTYDISNMSIQDFRIDYDVLQFKVGFNAFKMFYDGQFY